ncbi:DUF5791 family protein [Natronoglomus mannanivorans]|uniref:DUF5791 family protein n=1 Tax=Natronoglomus mannanivorans TaxID=2979990 RepID=A0AAP2YYK9_9EURY|nr:DUF5791 family protein [Halobacteria archaeon AArc-xg1-1]
MFYEQRMQAPDSPASLRAEYDEDLREAVDAVGLETAADATSVDADQLEALLDLEGESPDLDLEEAAEIQALAEGTPDPDTIVEMACEHLLLGMTTAVLDVDSLAGELEIDLDAKEVQQKIERRAPMSFDEFVHVQHVIASGSP